MNKFDHSLLILRKNFENSDRSMYAICVGWVNFVHSLRCLLNNLRSQQKIYATAGRTGRDKYHLCMPLLPMPYCCVKHLFAVNISGPGVKNSIIRFQYKEN